MRECIQMINTTSSVAQVIAPVKSGFTFMPATHFSGGVDKAAFTRPTFSATVNQVKTFKEFCDTYFFTFKNIAGKGLKYKTMKEQTLPLFKTDITGCMKALDGPWYSNFIKDNRGRKIAGAVVTDYGGKPNVFYLLSIAADPAHRGQGLPKALMQDIVETARKRGITEIYTSPNGNKLHPFFEKLGFLQDPDNSHNMVLRLK